jgi:hypothetical protein
MARWLAALVLVASVGTARADGFYFEEGFGGARVHDEMAAYMPDAFRVKIGVGLRRRQWAYEAWFAGNFNNDFVFENSHDSDLVAGGLDLKYIQPVARHLEVYLRGSAMVGGGTQALEGWSGRGLGVGAGIQLKGKGSVLGLLWWPLFFTNLGPKMTAALWLDSGYEFYRLHGDRPVAVDAQLSTLTFGLAVGTDF